MRMRRVLALLVVVLVYASRATASDAMFLRLFLVDGTPLVSYGEYARVDDRIIFSMPVGGSADQPRLYLMSIPAASIDWRRTDHYVVSARYQQYANTRGDTDFRHLSNDVARALSDIALTTEPAKALEIATTARARLAEWPAAHFGYRQREVTEIVAFLDESIANMRASAGVGAFDLALTASTAVVELEPLLGMPGVRESLEAVLALARITDRPADRVLLLQSALNLLDEAGTLLPTSGSTSLRAWISDQILEERGVDERYARLGRRLLTDAARAAGAARVSDVQAVLARVPTEDRRLGMKRPDVVVALQASLQAHLDSARKLRLLRDQWLVRRDFYRAYQRAVGTRLLRLVKAQPALEAIKRLEGPLPNALGALNSRLQGGAEQLQRMLPPQDLRGVHDMLVGAWRFAEQAVRSRRAAVSAGSVEGAWEASSAAAASLMLIAGVQDQLRAFVEPPRLR